MKNRYKESGAKRFFIALLLFAGLQSSLTVEAEDALTDVSTETAQWWSRYSGTSNDVQMPSADWWKCFEDPILDSLVEIGLQRNYNVAMATRRIEIAKNAVGSAKASYYPSFSLGIGYDKERASGLMYGSKGSVSNTSYLSGTINMSWEIDVFGKVTAQVKAKKAAVEVSRADHAGVLVSLAAQIATTYVDLRVAQAQITVANEHAASQMKALKIAEARYDSGLASRMDVDQAKTVYYSTIASIPTLESSVRQYINALAVLVVENPDDLYETLSVMGSIPAYLQPVANGIPADLLRRRPDVVEAEKEIDEYAAQLGIAKKDYLPDLSLTGMVGVAAHRPGDIFKSGAFQYSIAPTLSWTIFDGLARKYNVSAARETLQNAVDNYNLTVMTAFEETDNALSAYFSDLKYIDNLTKLVQASADYDKLAIDQYKNGIAAFINVADAQVSYLTYDNTLIQAQGQAVIALIDLYKALGGGWNNE